MNQLPDVGFGAIHGTNFDKISKLNH